LGRRRHDAAVPAAREFERSGIRFVALESRRWTVVVPPAPVAAAGRRS